MTTQIDAAAAIRAAVDARKGSLQALRQRIWSLLEALPVGVRLKDDDGLVCRIVRAEADGYQSGWSAPGIRLTGNAAINEHDQLVSCSDFLDSDHNGSNLFHRRGLVRLRHPEGEGDTLPPLSGKETRALALRLPAALAQYVAECEAETAANEATAV